MSDNLIPSGPELPLRCPVLKVIGVGGAGASLAAALAQTGLTGLSCAALDTSWRNLQTHAGLPTHLLGRRLLGGLSAGGDPKQGRAAAEADLPAIQSLVAGAEVVLVLAGLGGGTGSGVAPVVAQAAKAAGALVLGLVALPFDMEGSRRQRQAILALARLRQEADAVIPIPNQRIISLADTQLTVPQLFTVANERLVGAVRSLWRLLNLPGHMQLDLGALRAAVAAKHTECLFGSAEARGDNRAFDVWGQLQQDPGLAFESLSADAHYVVAGIAAGEDLMAAEMEWTLAQVRQQFGAAQILAGVAVDPSLNGRLSVTLLVARHGELLPEPAAPLPTLAVPAPPTIAPVADLPENLLPTESCAPRPPSRFVAPPPAISPEKTRQIYRRQVQRGRRKSAGGEQVLLPLDVISKGRFEKSDPTIRDGEDLDVPTYIRRGVPLN